MFEFSQFMLYLGISKVLHSLSDLMSIQEPDDSNEEFITLSDDQFSLQSYNRKQVNAVKVQISVTDQNDSFLDEKKI